MFLGLLEVVLGSNKHAEVLIRGLCFARRGSHFLTGDHDAESAREIFAGFLEFDDTFLAPLLLLIDYTILHTIDLVELDNEAFQDLVDDERANEVPLLMSHDLNPSINK